MSGVPGLSIASNPESPIVFLKLEKSTGSSKNDLRLLQEISDRVSQLFYSFHSSCTSKANFTIRLYLNPKSMRFQVLEEDSVFVVTSKRSALDKCRLPVGIRLFVSAGHSESDLIKVADSLKRVAGSVLKGYA